MFSLDLDNLKKAVNAIAYLGLGTGIAAAFVIIGMILVSVFGQQVANGNISVPTAANTSIQGVVTTSLAVGTTIIGLLSLVGGLASLVIVVLALLGKVDFTKAAGFNSGGKGNMF